ncbi:MAG: hypothetical protein Q8Q06_04645 [bacterium]|nr:hypothetical protein [bacterium]
MNYYRQLSIANKQSLFSLQRTEALLMYDKKFLAINIGVSILLAMTLVAYVFVSNHVVSQGYKIDRLKAQFNEASAKVVSLGQGVSRDVTVDEINSFAHYAGFVHSLEHDVVYTDSSVAIGALGR